KSWQISPDGKTNESVLRNDVFFHKHPNFGEDSTRIVVADDFVYSFDRVLNEKTASPGTWVFNNVESYKALNDSVLHVQLIKPLPAYLSLLSMEYASVAPKEITEDPEIDFRCNPVGTGPYQLKTWGERVKLVLRRAPNYHECDSTGNRGT